MCPLGALPLRGMGPLPLCSSQDLVNSHWRSPVQCGMGRSCVWARWPVRLCNLGGVPYHGVFYIALFACGTWREEVRDENWNYTRGPATGLQWVTAAPWLRVNSGLARECVDQKVPAPGEEGGP